MGRLADLWILSPKSSGAMDGTLGAIAVGSMLFSKPANPNDLLTVSASLLLYTVSSARVISAPPRFCFKKVAAILRPLQTGRFLHWIQPAPKSSVANFLDGQLTLQGARWPHRGDFSPAPAAVYSQLTSLRALLLPAFECAIALLAAVPSVTNQVHVLI